VSKHQGGSARRGNHGKTDLRYWQAAVFQPKYTRNGVVHQLSEWAVKIQHLGRRETFPLGTANRIEAAAKAKKIYLRLKSSGWEIALTNFKPKSQIPTVIATTVGEFLGLVIGTATARPKTIQCYCRAFRKIVADIFNIDGARSKYDYRTGGRTAWIAKIDKIKLSDITPDEIQKWKVRFLRQAGNNAAKQRVARSSVNSLMRQAKSLFSPEILKFVNISPPAPLPFSGVEFERRQSMRYRGSFDVREIIRAAQNELPVEQLKILLLATMAGLRRNEIDKLEWSAFQWVSETIRIEATQYFHPKSEDSLGDVEIDRELLALFRGFHSDSKTTFVIDSSTAPRPEATYSHYRCQRHFEQLTAWLRAKGVNSNMPLHTMRKEFGSQICAKYGIYAASRALRHADIAITSQHYLEPRRRATVGLGGLLRMPLESA
jgi:integrase